MPPIKKKCGVQLCKYKPQSNKQLFKAPSEHREKWFAAVGRKVGEKATGIYVCEDHFVLPHDTENYIRGKYTETKYKLKSDVVPHVNIPDNVCRICLCIINTNDSAIDLSQSGISTEVVKACLPEIDFLLTTSPKVCTKCYQTIESFSKLRKQALQTEVKIVNYLKITLEQAPGNLTEDCTLDLLECYNDIITVKEEPLTTTENVEVTEDAEVFEEMDIGKSELREEDNSENISSENISGNNHINVIQNHVVDNKYDEVADRFTEQKYDTFVVQSTQQEVNFIELKGEFLNSYTLTELRNDVPIQNTDRGQKHLIVQTGDSEV